MQQGFEHWAEAELARAPGSGRWRWQALAVEASNRRFYRLRRDGDAASVVAMHSPPALENNVQFERLARVLAAAGVGVPTLLAANHQDGYYLMTDLGTEHFADVYDREGSAAVMPAALVTLHRLQAVQAPEIPSYTRQRFADELGIYREWFLGRMLNTTAPAGLENAFELLLGATDRQPRCCVHRDFHSRNLLRTADGGVGVVDFQDALMGPATYDLASLLRDCYHCMTEADVARWREAYLADTPLPVDRATFARDFDLTALQRQLKAVGIFARLHLRDGRGSHLGHIVPVLRRIGRLAAAYPELAELAQHVDAVLPRTRRSLGDAP